MWLKLPGMGSGRSVYGADGDNEFSAIAILGKYAYIALHDYMDQKTCRYRRAGVRSGDLAKPAWY